MIQWKPESKYNQKSETQAEAMIALLDAMKGDKKGGIVILPCGSGKSALIAEVAMLGNMNLILSYEKQGVIQLTAILRDHTTLKSSDVCQLTGETKDVPNDSLCFVVMTYGLFASSIGATRRGQVSTIGQFLLKQVWDCVLCDEVHHACAATYKPFLQNLKLKSSWMFGFTGTLFRSDYALNDTREQHEKSAFGWFGEVIFRRSCNQLESSGMIAKVRRRTIKTPFTEEFAFAHDQTSGSMRVNLHSVHPTKLNALKHLCAAHKGIGQTGMVFANHLFGAKIIRIVLGERWEILAGSNAHGDESNHSTTENSRIVSRFNAGKLDGLISTSVGESSLDVYNPTFSFLIVMDAHGGEAAAAQRAGRLFRTPRVLRKPGQSDASIHADRLLSQKSGFYYEFVTPNTEEEAAAEARERKFDAEGYAKSETIEMSRIMGMANTAGTQMDFADLRDCMALLKLTLSYQELGRNAVLGKTAAAAIRAPHTKHVSGIRSKAKKSSTIFKTRYENQAKQLSKMAPLVQAQAKVANRKVLLTTSLPPCSIAIFRKLRLDKLLLQDLEIDLNHQGEESEECVESEEGVESEESGEDEGSEGNE